MKLTYNWLLEHLSVPLTIEEITNALNSLSIEIDHINQIGGKGYVVGKILDFKNHGEKLKICEIVYTDENKNLIKKEIICGAPNVKKNMYTIVALENTILSNGTILKPKNINGFLSSGMCLSYEEFGLKHLHSEGIIDESIDFLNELVKEDYIINIGIPANRIDISSIYGLAMEIASYYKINLKPLIVESKNPNLNLSIEVECEENTCNNFSTLEINNITIKDNYHKIKSFLGKISGLNSIELVNIGNFITKDLGVPLHIYNKDLMKKLKIVFGKSSEKFLTLENEEITINEKDILIKNENNETMVLAGLIGSDKYKINSQTKNILVEVGIFNKNYIIPTSNRLKINTDSSYFFKRGINYNNYLIALNYMQNFIDGDFSKINMVKNLPKIISPIFLSYKEFYEKTHTAFSLEIITEKLKQYKYEVEIINKSTEDLNNEMGLLIRPPLYKCHIDSSASIIEDIIRISNKSIDRELITINLQNETKENLDEIFYENIFKVKEYLINMGLEEIITYSFSEKGEIEIENPIVYNEKFLRSTLACHMEKSLINLIKDKSYINDNYGTFEISKVFHNFNNNISEYTNLSIGLIKNTYHFNLNIENYLKYILLNIGIIWNLKIEIKDILKPDNKDINKIHIYINGSLKGYMEFFKEYIILEIENLEALIKKPMKIKPRIYKDTNLEYTIRDYSFFTNINYNEIEKSLYKIKNIDFCLLDLFKNNEEISYTIRFKILNNELLLKEQEILDNLNKINVTFR